jgi:HEAT repeat protein
MQTKGVGVQYRRTFFLLARGLLIAVFLEAQLTMIPRACRVDAGELRDKETRRGGLREGEGRNLNHPDPIIRLEALGSLAKSKGKAAIPQFILALSDPDDRVRLKAIDLLGRFKAKDAVPTLVGSLSLTSSRAEKLKVIVALGDIGDHEASGPIALFLRRPDVDRETKAAALVALGGIGDARAKDALTEILHHDPDQEIRRIAGEALERQRR